MDNPNHQPKFEIKGLKDALNNPREAYNLWHYIQSRGLNLSETRLILKQARDTGCVLPNLIRKLETYERELQSLQMDQKLDEDLKF